MNPRTSPEDLYWRDDVLDHELDQDMADDIQRTDFGDPGDEDELDFDELISPKYFTARQRVEIAREEQWLRSLTSDFEELDEIDGFDDDRYEELSY